jgi:hypothetical protein
MCTYASICEYAHKHMYAHMYIRMYIHVNTYISLTHVGFVGYWKGCCADYAFRFFVCLCMCLEALVEVVRLAYVELVGHVIALG